MNNIKNYAFLLLMAGLTGCGGGGDSSDSSVTSDTTNELTGKVADGYLSGAKICLDMDLNMSCSEDEPSSISSSDGIFSLNITLEQSELYPIIAIVTPDVIDLDTETNIPNAYTLVSPPGKYEFISPITTLLALNAQDYSDESLQMSALRVREELGLSEDIDLFSDFIAAQETANENHIDDYQLLHNTAQLTARMLGQHLTDFNLGNTSGAIDEDELFVAVDNILDSLDELVELASSDSFDADSIALLKAQEWSDEVEEVIPSEVADTIKEKLSLPKVLNGGVYQYISLDNVITEYLTIYLISDDEDFDDLYSITVSSENGYSYTFTNEDRTNDNLDFENQVAYKKILPEGTLTSDTYNFKIESTSGTSTTLITDIYTVPSIAPYDNNLLESDLEWIVETGYDEIFLTYPIEDDEIYFKAYLYNADNTIINEDTFVKGKNKLWLDNDDISKSISQVLVEESDGDNARERNYIRQLFKKDVTESDAQSYVFFSRTYFKKTFQKDDEEDLENVYQFNIGNIIEDINSSPLDPILESLQIEYFDPDTSSYKNILDITLDYEVLDSLDATTDEISSNVVSDYGFSQLTRTIDFNTIYNYSFLDAFFVAKEELPIGTYRYSATDINDETYFSYDFYGGKSDTFPDLSYSSFSASTLSDDWYQLNIETTKNSDGNLYYEFQVNVTYTNSEDKIEDKYLFNLGKSRENVALLSKSQLKEAVESFESVYSVSVDTIFIDASVYDGSSDYKVDQRYEIRELDLSEALNVNNIYDLLN